MVYERTIGLLLAIRRNCSSQRAACVCFHFEFCFHCVYDFVRIAKKWKREEWAQRKTCATALEPCSVARQHHWARIAQKKPNEPKEDAVRTLEIRSSSPFSGGRLPVTLSALSFSVRSGTIYWCFSSTENI